MKSYLLTILAGLVVTVCPVSAKDAAADETPGGAKAERTERELAEIRLRNKSKAAEAWGEDKKKRKAKEFAELESDYQEINQNYKAADVKDRLAAFITKWKDGNRVGCATMYLAQKTGGGGREELLKKCVSEFSEAYYLDGCSVGGLARLYLAGHYQKSGNEAEVRKLVKELEKDYAEAVDHSGNLLIDQLGEMKAK